MGWEMKTERLSARLVRREGFAGTEENPVPTYAHWCPGCRSMHDIAVEKPFTNGAKWTFDGNVEAPTFGPSVNIGWGPMRDGKMRRCHYFLKAGKISFCGDCTHELVGQTVELPPIPREVWMRAGLGPDGVGL